MEQRDPRTSQFIRNAMKREMLAPQTEHALAIAWRDQRDEAALHRLINAYSRLAVSVATRFRRYGMPLDDLIQQGNLGLMRAAEKYDPENGARFSTYAAWWIRASMQEYVMRNWSVVRTATNASQKKLFFHLRKTLSKLDDGETRNEALSTSVARELDVPEAQVEIMLGRMSGQDLSLNSPKAVAKMTGATGWTRSRMTAPQPKISCSMTWKRGAGAGCCIQQWTICPRVKSASSPNAICWTSPARWPKLASIWEFRKSVFASLKNVQWAELPHSCVNPPRESGCRLDPAGCFCHGRRN